jgi:glycosyltransferase involved in cell wall biosynthesis
MKRILIFSTAYLPLIGGAEIAVKEITDRLVGGFTFDLICARIKPELAKEEKVGQVQVYRLGSGAGRLDKFLLPWRGSALAKKLARQNKYDAIWAVMASFGGLAALFFKKKNPNAPYLLTLQEGDTPEHIHSRARWLGPYFRQMFTRADFITAISQYLAKWARQMGARGPVEVVPNGVEVKKFEIRNSKFETNFKFQILNFKKELGLKGSDKVLITVSRLVEKNAVADIIKSLTHLPVKVKLLILGDGPERKKLEALARKLKLGDRVIFLGQAPNSQVPSYLAAADVFIRPSLSEGQGISFLEAMAAGVPVIATPVGGIVDFLRHQETGLFCEVKDPASLAEQVRILLANPELAEKIRKQARDLVLRDYDWDLIAIKMKNIFDKITT